MKKLHTLIPLTSKAGKLGGTPNYLIPAGESPTLIGHIAYINSSFVTHDTQIVHHLIGTEESYFTEKGIQEIANKLKVTNPHMNTVRDKNSHNFKVSYTTHYYPKNYNLAQLIAGVLEEILNEDELNHQKVLFVRPDTFIQTNTIFAYTQFLKELVGLTSINDLTIAVFKPRNLKQKLESSNVFRHFYSGNFLLIDKPKTEPLSIQNGYQYLGILGMFSFDVTLSNFFIQPQTEPKLDKILCSILESDTKIRVVSPGFTYWDLSTFESMVEFYDSSSRSG